MLKGTIKKQFLLKNNDEELVKSVSDNLVLYNKKTLEVKNQMRIANTKGEFGGNGQVLLLETVKGIIVDSENTQTIIFSSDDRAEELILSLQEEFGLEKIDEF
jgi:hypothetical protein